MDVLEVFKIYKFLSTCFVMCIDQDEQLGSSIRLSHCAYKRGYPTLTHKMVSSDGLFEALVKH